MPPHRNEIGVNAVGKLSRTREGRLNTASDSRERNIGLCATCTHMRRVESDRGAVFYRCALADTDPGFPKYPRLPVLQCDGYKRTDDLAATIARL